jgi:hypothetical protein
VAHVVNVGIHRRLLLCGRGWDVSPVRVLKQDGRRSISKRKVLSMMKIHI